MPKLSKEDVIAKLVELEVEYELDASYSDLLALLKDNEPVVEDKEEEAPEIVLEAETEEEKEIVEKVVNPFSSFESKLPMTGKAMEMKKHLAAQPKQFVNIPLGADEKVGSTHQVTLNGYTLFIIKGMQVEVPLQVAEVLEAKFQHQLNVKQHPLRVGGVGDIKLQEFN